MTRSQVRKFVEESSVERLREVLDRVQNQEAFFRDLADKKLQQ
jgi:hypothetical protein